MEITPTDATFGALLTDVSLAELDETTWQQIRSAFLEYAALIFPGQNITPEQQIQFARRFGEIEQLAKDMRLDAVHISNQKADGSVLDIAEHGARILKGNEGWHLDSTYMPVAAFGAVMSAHVVPPEGGQTEFADMRAAYDALDDEMKDKVEDLSAYHSLYYSQARIGHMVAPGSGYGFHDYGPPLRPIVKVHPETHRKSLYIGRHAYGIPGLEPEESEKLLADLVYDACQAPRTYSHAWQPGDTVVWDNRCLLHRARPYDRSQPRVLLHSRIAGDSKTEFAASD